MLKLKRSGPRRPIGPRLWFAVLLASICLEGLGRKMFQNVPQFAWYFLKDGVLLAGLLAFKVGRNEIQSARGLYRGFVPFLLLGAIWTVCELANPQQSSLLLGLIGLRAYWLWWIAPLVVASALRREDDRRGAVAVLAGIAIFIGVYAAIQFEFPGDAPINRYAWGADEMGIASVGETGRVRVTSTFSYLSGFTDFGILALTVLLALGLGEGRGWRKVLCFAGASAIGLTLPMSGARAPIVLGGLAALCVVWAAGALRSREGRGIVAAAVAVGVLGWFGAPEAVQGIESRFGYSDTSSRFAEVLQLLPPVAIAENDYPQFGVGTGMQQNARFALGVRTDFGSEGEAGRHLAELGPAGYLFVWLARMGLVVALLRAMRLFARAGKRPLAGAALAYSGLTLLGNLTFDHVWQALYFVGLGLILQAAAAIGAHEAAGERSGLKSLRRSSTRSAVV